MAHFKKSVSDLEVMDKEEKREALRAELQDFLKMVTKSLEKANEQEFKDGVQVIRELEGLLSKLEDSDTSNQAQGSN